MSTRLGSWFLRIELLVNRLLSPLLGKKMIWISALLIRRAVLGRLGLEIWGIFGNISYLTHGRVGGTEGRSVNYLIQSFSRCFSVAVRWNIDRVLMRFGELSWW